MAFLDELGLEEFWEKIKSTFATRRTLENDYLYAKTIEADYLKTANLEAESAQIGLLSADSAVIQELEAKTAKVDQIDVEQITADHAIVGSLDANYAKLDKTNISEAWVKDLFVQGGFVAQDGTVYKLTGVHIDANDVTAGTLTVDRLQLQGEDGLYYALNVSAIGEAAFEQLPADVQTKCQSKLHADSLVAHSVTAEQITVNNLVGTGGWINLASGTFAYGNAGNGNGISWDGSKLTITADSIKIGTSAVARASDVPTSVSQLTNDSGYATMTAVEGKGYQTAAQVQTAAEEAASPAYAAAATADGKATSAASAASAAATAAANADAKAVNAASAAATADGKAVAAQTAADNAAKTATNYLGFDSNGLVIGDMTAATLGKNTLIDANGVAIRSGTTETARFGSDTVGIAKNNADATISIRNDTFRIETDSGATRMRAKADAFYVEAAGNDSDATSSYFSLNRRVSGGSKSASVSMVATASGGDTSFIRVGTDGQDSYVSINADKLSINTKLMGDFVTSEGMVNGWYVRTYASGYKDMWTIATGTMTSTVKGVGIRYPIEFESRPNINVSAGVSGTIDTIAKYTDANTVECNFYVSSAASGVPYWAFVRVYGK